MYNLTLEVTRGLILRQDSARTALPLTLRRTTSSPACTGPARRHTLDHRSISNKRQNPFYAGGPP
jgi:hypothetical protein